MPQSETSIATLRPDLASSFTEFDLEMNMNNFVAQQVLRPITVAKKTGTFGKIPVEQLLKKRETLRAPGGHYSRSDFTFQTATYACEEHGAEEPVDDDEREMYLEYFDAEVVSTLRAHSDVLLNAEARGEAAVFDTSVWTGGSLTTAVTTEWSTAATATPIADVKAAAESVWSSSGLWPNAIVFNRHVFRNVRATDDVKDNIAASGAGDGIKATDITVQMLAQVFDLPFVIVAGGTENSANEGAGFTANAIWDDEYAMICRIATTDDPREPCIGRTFYWPGGGGLPQGTVETYRDETVRSDIVRVRHDVDELILYAEAGHLLTNITA